MPWPETASGPACRRSWASIAAALVLVGLILAPVSAAPEDEAEKAARALLCDCGCPPQSVHDCACGRAAELRADLLRRARAGADADAIIAAYVAEKGEQALIAPPASGFNLLAWLVPGALLVLGIGAVGLIVRRWGRSAGAEGTEAAIPDPAEEIAGTTGPDDEDRRRLEEALEKML